MVRFWDRLVKSVAALLTLLALATWMGPLHPIGDSLAVLRVPLVALAALAVIWTGWPRWVRWPLAAVALAALGQVAAMKLTTPEPGQISVYQRNLLYQNRQVDAVAADVLARRPDVVTLQEVSGHNRRLLDLLRADYPYQHICKNYGWDVAVLSRHPVVAGATVCSSGRRLAGIKVALPQGPAWVLSVHLFWPWPHDQHEQVQRIKALVAGLNAPVILSGDFNMVPWGSDEQRLSQAADLQLAGPLQPTFYVEGPGPLSLPLPLDQVWAPGGGRVEVLPRLGSDHAGVLARVHLDAD